MRNSRPLERNTIAPRPSHVSCTSRQMARPQTLYLFIVAPVPTFPFPFVGVFFFILGITEILTALHHFRYASCSFALQRPAACMTFTNIYTFKRLLKRHVSRTKWRLSASLSRSLPFALIRSFSVRDWQRTHKVPQFRAKRVRFAHTSIRLSVFPVNSFNNIRDAPFATIWLAMLSSF